jgi:hypothetical protein
LPNYNPHGVQSSEPGTHHAADATDLFAPASNEDEEGLGDLDDDEGEEGDEAQLDSKAGTPADDEWEPSPPPTQHRHLPVPAASPSPSPAPPPSTQRSMKVPKVEKGSRNAPAVMSAPHGKKGKKTAVDSFNENRRLETERLDLKRKMDHDERMAAMTLKKHKYELRYRSTPTRVDSPAYSTPSTDSSDDKKIEILRLQIRLAELTQGRPSTTPVTPSFFTDNFEVDPTLPYTQLGENFAESWTT